jgi:hypothetical protein
VSQMPDWGAGRLNVQASRLHTIRHASSRTPLDEWSARRRIRWLVHCDIASRIRTEFRPDPARKLYDIYHCCVNSEKLLMMDRGTVRNR